MKGFIILFAFKLCTAGNLPSDYKTCHDLNTVDDCLKGSINEVIPKLKYGIASLNVPSLDPLFIPSMVIGEGDGGTVHLVQDFKNIQLHGASKSVVNKIDASKISNFTLYAETITPHLVLEADYSLRGRLLLIPIQGEGKCKITLENVTVTHLSLGEKITKKGIHYMKVKDYVITLLPQKVQYNFDNLFGGDQYLGSNVNLILNENWKEVFEDVRPSYEESLGLVFGDFANKIYTKVPFKELFGITV